MDAARKQALIEMIQAGDLSGVARAIAELQSGHTEREAAESLQQFVGQQPSGWDRIVVTVHDDRGVRGSLVIRPRSGS